MSSPAFAIRREVIEYGALPIASWLGQIDSTAAVLQLLKQLVDAAPSSSGTDRTFISVPALAGCLDVPLQHAKVLVDVLDAVAEERQMLVQKPPGDGSPEADLQPATVDVFAVALFLVAQLYIRQCQRPEAMDVWPDRGPNHGDGAGPASPSRITSPASPVHFQVQKSTNLVRMELQTHIQQHHHMLAGYTDFMIRRAHVLLSLVRSQPASDSNITAQEFDRLALLLRRTVQPDTSSTGTTPADDAAPMDTSPISPRLDDSWCLSACVPLFSDPAHAGNGVPVAALSAWLTENIIDELMPAETMAGGQNAAVSPAAVPTSPLTKVIDLPPAGIAHGPTVDMQGVVKSTIVRGEDSFPAGALRVTDCHDMAAYALAPLQYASVLGCSNCTLVIGAVGRMLRIEGCTKVTLICAAVRVCISSCHECTFYLGVNRPPLLIGLNRFVQLAPYNTGYERLAGHMASAGVAASPNLWDRPVTLALQHGPATPDSHSPSGGQAVSLLNEHPPVQLLPPEKLLPFMIPFLGGRGNLCGGPASFVSTPPSRQSSGDSPPMMSPDLGNLVGLDDGTGNMTQAPPGPFRLPPAYEEAKERKVAAVSELRNAVKQAVLDDARKRELQAVIQAHFKEWLNSSGNMRQVYDLARMEREESS
ncbi:hypothetical protein WJX73_001581 [Symbiochloris irregularis]|uniref:TBCC domain-containing protein 1 n=1 Tax=Symbiochloris irregularis TaxID=706552 RepID=A0AAW1PRA5_9CHLO